MLTTSTSPSVADLESSTFDWPQSSQPWVVTTLVVDVDEAHARVQPLCAASGMEMACSLSATGYRLVSIQCYLIDKDRWRMRVVTEVLVGMLGEEAVAVFRDDQGNNFCPDAPDLPAARVTELVFVGGVVGRPFSSSPTAAATTGRRLHSAFFCESSEGGNLMRHLLPERKADRFVPQAKRTCLLAL